MAVNNHVVLVGYNPTYDDIIALYSTDDGVTWVDASASLQAVTGFAFADLDMTLSLATNGNTWLLVDKKGLWAASNDSATWFGTDDIANHKNIMLGASTTVEAVVNGCGFLRSYDYPTTPGNQWNRWLVWGYSYPLADPTNHLGYLPIITQAKWKAGTPLDVSTDWTRDITLPTGRSTRPMSVLACAHDWYRDELWVLAFGHDTLRFELWLADTLETASGAFTLADETDLLPDELRFRSLNPTTFHSIRATMFFDIGLRRIRMLISAPAYTAAYERDCAAFSSTPFYRYDFASHNVATWMPQLLQTSAPSSTAGQDGTQYLSGGAWTDLAYIPGPRYEHQVDTTELTGMYPGVRTALGTYIRPIWGTVSYDTTAIVRGPTPEDGWASPVTSAVLDLMGEAMVAGAAPPGVVDVDPTAAVTYHPVLTIVAIPPAFCGRLEEATAAPTAATLTTWLPTTLKWHSLSDTVALSLADESYRLLPLVLADALATSCAVVDAATFVLSSVAAFTGAPTDNITQRMTVLSSMALIDSLLLEWLEVLSDSMATTCVALPVHQKIAVLLDLMTLSGPATNRIEAVHALADALTTACLLQVAPIETVSDIAAFADPVVDLIEAMEVLLDALDAADATVVSGRIVGVVADTVTIGTTLLSAMTMLDSLTDEVSFYTTFRIGDEVYRGYVLNAANKAASEYTNFAFNSMATLGRRPFAASSGGLYELTGDDDDGTIIESAVRTGIMAIAAGKQAQVISAYLGYTSTGTVVLKAILTSAGGEKREHWYRLDEQNADAMREGRFKLGLGLKSVYWAFEVCNVAGETLDLDNIKLHRIALDRRL